MDGHVENLHPDHTVGASTNANPYLNWRGGWSMDPNEQCQQPSFKMADTDVGPTTRAAPTPPQRPSHPRPHRLPNLGVRQ